MYQVIGTDQREYGPVSADFIRQWIKERRLNSESRVRHDHQGEWQSLGSFPEFEVALQAVHNLSQGILTSANIKTNPLSDGLATTGLVMGIISVVPGFCCMAGIPFNVIGVILCSIALLQIKRQPHEKGGKGAAITGLVLSLATLTAAIILIIWQLTKQLPS